VVFVDLDYFKEVNDALGHDAGDRLLVELARRLRLVARPGELVARVGGDEFVLVLAVDGHEDASARVESLMRALDDRVESGGLRLAVNVSVGLATLGPEDAGITADEAVQRADSAMYLAKTSGRNRWAAYDDDLRGRDRLRSEVWQLLDNSLREGRVAVVFQPVVDLESGRIVGAEALARIRDPLPTLLSPEVFLDVAEETGLIVPLGEAVVAEACARLGEWTRIDPDFVVTVNLSGRQLAHPGAGRMILRALDAVGVAPDRLCVEITESVLIEVVGDLADSVQDLRRAGVRLARPRRRPRRSIRRRAAPSRRASAPTHRLRRRTNQAPRRQRPMPPDRRPRRPRHPRTAGARARPRCRRPPRRSPWPATTMARRPRTTRQRPRRWPHPATPLAVARRPAGGRRRPACPSAQPFRGRTRPCTRSGRPRIRRNPSASVWS